jgi:hypothetical protein
MAGPDHHGHVAHVVAQLIQCPPESHSETVELAELHGMLGISEDAVEACFLYDIHAGNVHIECHGIAVEHLPQLHDI